MQVSRKQTHRRDFPCANWIKSDRRLQTPDSMGLCAASELRGRTQTDEKPVESAEQNDQDGRVANGLLLLWRTDQTISANRIA